MSSYICECIPLLERELNTEEMKLRVDEFLKKASLSSKWMLYSDYCLDDKNKPNDVITFVLIPFISEAQYQELEKKINETQPVDIKHTRNIDTGFIAYIKEQPVFSFSFIVNNRQEMFGDDNDEQVKTVQKILEEIRKTFKTWCDNEEKTELKDYFNSCVTKIDRQLNEIFLKKKVKDHIDILLITILGAYFSAAILKRLPKLEIFGWFPDRDKTNESCDQIATPIFNAMQYNHMEARQYQFCASRPDTKTVPFYDNENRIADVICGTIADYNIHANLVSKDKFSIILQDLIADNVFIHIYRFTIKDNRLHLGIIKISLQHRFVRIWKNFVIRIKKWTASFSN